MWDGTNAIIRLLDKTVYEGECFIYTGQPSKIKDWEAPMVRGRDGFGHAIAVVSYRELVGPIKRGLSILHRCDRARCWRPSHLYQGTDLQNANDREVRGRGGNFKGEKHPKVVLTDEKVRSIKLMLQAGGSASIIARKFGVSRAAINHIKYGENWRHV